jgi:hypothetical protein
MTLSICVAGATGWTGRARLDTLLLGTQLLDAGQ